MARLRMIHGGQKALAKADVSSLRRLISEARKNKKKIAVIGLGNDLCSDDSAGNLVASNIAVRMPPDVTPVVAGTVPQAAVADILRAKPAVVICIDSADFEARPGTICLARYKDKGFSAIKSHSTSLSRLIGYLAQFIDCDFYALAIQAKDVSYGGEPTPEVEDAIREVSEAICS